MRKIKKDVKGRHVCYIVDTKQTLLHHQCYKNVMYLRVYRTILY